MPMSKKLTVNGKEFKSQKEAKDFFSAIRKKYCTEEDIVDSDDFDMLNDLYVRYCQVTDYKMKGKPRSFYVKNIVRCYDNRHYSTTRGFAVKFDNGSEEEFSVDTAIQKISNQGLNQPPVSE